jgi:hypothetical protein
MPNTNKCGISTTNNKEWRKRLEAKYGVQPIFLTTDISFIITTQAGKDWVRKNKPVILEILTKDLVVEDEFDYLKERWSRYYSSYEAAKKAHQLGVSYICKHPIPVDAIKVFGSAHYPL